MKKTNLILTTIAILILIIGSILVLMDTNSEKESIKIGYRGHLGYLPAYVTQVNNYYSEEGLNVKLIEFDSTNQLVEAVISGDIDAAVGGVNTVVPLTIETKSPGSLRIFNLGILTDELDALVVSKDSNINTIQDLKGKTISALPGTASKIWMDMMLEKENLKGQVNVIQTASSQQLNALSSGSVDAIFDLEPLITMAEEKNIGRVLIKSPITKYYKTDLLFETSVISTDFIKKNPEAAKKIIKAVDKAIVFINNNPEAAKKYYSEFTPVDDTIEAKLPVLKYIPSYEMNVQEFQEVADFLFVTGLIEKQVDAQKILIK